MEFQDQNSSETKISKIQEYAEQGYLFHGSTNDNIDVLQPKLANDMDINNSFNNDCAVFASRLPEVSIFGLISTKSVPEEILDDQPIVVGRNRDKHLFVEIPIKLKPYIEKNTGVLYVLPSTTFDLNQIGWQVKSKEEVKPIDKISIEFEDFKKLGGEVIWRE